MSDKVELLLQELRQKYFKDVTNISIVLQRVRKCNYFAATSRSISGRFKILYHKKLLKASDDTIKGCLAHELAHIEADSRKNFLFYLLEGLFLIVSPSYETNTERRIDKKVLEIGLGHELLAFQKFHDKYYEAYNKLDGLTKKEIKEYLKFGRLPNDLK